VAAARALGTLRYAPARARLEAALDSKRLRDSELSERIAFFEAYGGVAGAEGVPLLDRVLNGKSWLGRRESGETRACAALGLGRIRHPAAEKALNAAAADADPGGAERGGPRAAGDAPVSAPATSLHPGDDRGVQLRGRDLLFAMAAATRALQLYPLENQAVVNALAELDTTARALLDQEGELSVRYVGDFFFVNDLRLRIDLASYATFGLVGRALQRHGNRDAGGLPRRGNGGVDGVPLAAHGGAARGRPLRPLRRAADAQRRPPPRRAP
jgi:hypothetical protein